jgi:Domain of unknown function (DUF4124)
MHNARASSRPLLLATLLAFSAFSASSAFAQYQWRDANGQMIISDQPPPASVKPSQIIKSAPMPVPVAAAPKVEAKDAKVATAKGPLTTADKELEFQKRRKEQAESQKTGAEKQAAAEQKAKHCETLQQKLRTLDSGLKISSVQKNGELAAMEAADREMESSKTRRELATSQCSS